MKTLTTVFLMRNEEKSAKNVLSEAVKTLKKTKYDWNILVIDNHSEDKTPQVVRKLAKQEPKITLIRHDANKGYAGSIRTALKKAEGNIIVIIDGDGQHTSADILAFVDKINEGYDHVVGWKKIRNDPIYRTIMSSGYNFLCRMLFNMKLHDIDCGFMALTKKLAKNIEIKYDTVPVGAEIFARAKKIGMKSTELEVKHFPRKFGKSVFRAWRIPLDIIRITVSLIKLKKEIG